MRSEAEGRTPYMGAFALAARHDQEEPWRELPDIDRIFDSLVGSLYVNYGGHIQILLLLLDKELMRYLFINSMGCKYI